MKKLFYLLSLVLLGCTCNAQLQVQYLYADSNCNAVLPDYTLVVQARDNCSNVTLEQSPEPGSLISGNMSVTISATDESGNNTTARFDVFLLDTIAPILEWPDSVITSLFFPVERWIAADIKDFNEKFYGTDQDKDE